MKSIRHRAREFALQGLYQWFVAGGEAAGIASQLRDARDFGQADDKLFTQIFLGAIAESDALCAALTPLLDRPLAELSPVERGVLLLGAYELAHCPAVPYRVIINEAVELAKSFGGTDGHKYVNGVLDKLAPLLRAEEVQKAKVKA
ncbi:MAG: transcription antitermination factor NusB [Betaproteobacteria bacterium]|nr:transcription antitermination factor NusB [Pseudomonadota bacterium]